MKTQLRSHQPRISDLKAEQLELAPQTVLPIDTYMEPSEQMNMIFARYRNKEKPTRPMYERICSAHFAPLLGQHTHHHVHLSTGREGLQ